MESSESDVDDSSSSSGSDASTSEDESAFEILRTAAYYPHSEPELQEEEDNDDGAFYIRALYRLPQHSIRL
jgi:hypothetical protein